MIRGQETFVIGKLILPLHFGLLISKWGLVHGFCLLFVTHCVLGNYYFPLALMNHNTEKTWQIERRNQSEDWGIAQLHSCADWSCDLRFWQAGLYLWLNFHTVHHRTWNFANITRRNFELAGLTFLFVRYSISKNRLFAPSSHLQDFGQDMQRIQCWIQCKHTWTSLQRNDTVLSKTQSKFRSQILVYAGGGIWNAESQIFSFSED